MSVTLGRIHSVGKGGLRCPWMHDQLVHNSIRGSFFFLVSELEIDEGVAGF